METNLEKAKRLYKAQVAIQGFELPENSYVFKMMKLAAAPDVINKNDCIAGVIGSLVDWKFCKIELPEQSIYVIGSYSKGGKSFLCRYSNDDLEAGWLNRDGDYIETPIVWCNLPIY